VPASPEAHHPQRARRIVTPLADFLREESAGGVVLLAATLLALIWANSPWQERSTDLWHTTLTVGPGSYTLHEDLQHWVNDGLMAVFFFVVGLEIKRELVVGELRDPRAVAAPAVAALGGMLVPALLFLAVTAGTDASKGWAIPIATDIAFAVGLLTLVGRRAPASLKLFVLTLAIVDDIGAIVVIAWFYSGAIDVAWLAGAAACVAVMLVMRRAGIWSPWAYVLPAVVLWLCVFESGVHATIAGVALGLLTPARSERGTPPVERLEHLFHPVASFVVVPLFALANAGVELSRESLSTAIDSRLTWAIVIGLVVGKTAGITGATLAAARSRIGRLPEGLDGRSVLGAGALGGIGFTVSLFVAGMAFAGSARLDEAKLGILAGSLLSAALGASVLARARGS
jgi:NhaA family Na+:H+ antiporter